MTYPYISIQLIDGEIKVLCNEYKRPLHGKNETLHSFKFCEENWKNYNEVFEFANEDETDKVTKHLVNKGTPDNYNLLYNGIQVTCIEIKDGKAWFKEEKEEDNQEWLLTELISMYNAEYTSEEILTKFKITRK